MNQPASWEFSIGGFNKNFRAISFDGITFSFDREGRQLSECNGVCSVTFTDFAFPTGLYQLVDWINKTTQNVDDAFTTAILRVSTHDSERLTWLFEDVTIKTVNFLKSTNNTQPSQPSRDVELKFNYSQVILSVEKIESKIE